ncbi:hypothetical protein LEP1GSC013_0647 [Leptospira interrogans serovar Valbuzzi str. Duyster]|nr:hypothetical protein LEP1GSC013_0647 [Leptospira interrogans serovar Valbuzzi str. Duyster]ENO71386.1 hypothetical protein LEP1GSC012_0005 [Leptospira interrogans serovar Valbuzzi str. Valbuzzi]
MFSDKDVRKQGTDVLRLLVLVKRNGFLGGKHEKGIVNHIF